MTSVLVGLRRSAAPNPKGRDRATPWLAIVLALALSGVVGTVVAGTILAMAGWFRPLVVVPAAVAATAGLFRLLGRRHVIDGSDALRGRPAAAVLAIAVGAVLLNGAHASNHVLTDRDPGVYSSTARWLAREGTLLIDARRGPFEDDDLRIVSLGFYDATEEGDIRPQFLHGWPALLATAHWFGGDRLLFRMPALLGGLALLALYALATLRLRPWPAVAATAALALALPQLYVSRDVYSEAPTQLVLFGGTWALVRALKGRDVGLAAGAGIVLATTLLLRIDAALYLIALPPFLAAEWLRGRSLPNHDRRRLNVVVIAVTGALAGLGVLSVVDGLVWSPAYVRALRSQLTGLMAVLAFSAAASLAVAALAANWGRRWARRPVGRAVAANASAVVVVLLGTLAAVRPALQTVRAESLPFIEQVQTTQGLALDGTRRYSEDSLLWLTWYLSPVTVAAAVIAAALAARELVLGRLRGFMMPLLGFLAVAVVYLASPSAAPDHLWVMRRFVPVVVPGTILLAVALADRLLSARPALARAAGIAVLAATLVVPLVRLVPVVGARQQLGYLDAITDACDAMGDDAAAIVLAEASFELVFPQTLRSWCDVPVATAPPGLAAARYEELAAGWRAEGRTLHVVARTGIEAVPDGDVVAVVQRTNDRELEKSFTEPPDELIEARLGFQVIRISPP